VVAGAGARSARALLSVLACVCLVGVWWECAGSPAVQGCRAHTATRPLHTRAHTHTHTHAHSRTRAHAHTHTHTHTLTHTHTHTHTHAHLLDGQLLARLARQPAVAADVRGEHRQPDKVWQVCVHESA
jgi:ABC-type nickel/cobalt efflux system permease component RcnA